LASLVQCFSDTDQGTLYIEIIVWILYTVYLNSVTTLLLLYIFADDLLHPTINSLIPSMLCGVHAFGPGFVLLNLNNLQNSKDIGFVMGIQCIPQLEDKLIQRPFVLCFL